MNKVVSKSKCGRKAMIITPKGTKHVQMKNGAWINCEFCREILLLRRGKGWKEESKFIMKMRGKLLICTKCGGESGNHHEDCDCKEALSKLMFLDYEISLKNQQAFFNQTD